MNDDRHPSARPTPWRLLKRADQAALAVLNLFAIAAISGYWVAQGGLSGRLIDVDRRTPQTAQFQIDPNSAEWPEWAQLPEIGETLARRIVESRQQQGPFQDVEDLRRVRGIGPRTLEKIRPYIRPTAGAGQLVQQQK